MPQHVSIGLLGGTFDPIHLGHIHLALSVRDALQLDEVRLLPAGNPPLREAPLATPQQRLEMVRLAVEHHPRLRVDESDMQPDGVSYAILSLMTLRAQLPDAALCYMLGIDQFMQFERWQQWQDIPNYAHLVITSRMTRQGFRPSPALEALLRQRRVTEPQALTRQTAGCIFFQDITPLPISATEIRRQFQQGLQPYMYLPEAVWDYINTMQLYR